MKKRLLSVMTALAVLPSALSSTATAADKTPDYSLWDKFIKYDLCIADYDSLTDEQQELCHFIFDTEQAANDTVICERARRTLAGDDVGERITLEQLEDAYGIWENYSYFKSGWQTYIDCIPDIIHLSDDSNSPYYGSYQKCEYWLDDTRSKYVIFSEKTSTDDTSQFEVWDENDIFLHSFPTALSDCPYKDFRYDEDYMKKMGYIEKNGGYYYIKPDNTAVFAWSIYTNSDDNTIIKEPFIIEDEINGCPVKAIEHNALADTRITEVILPESIEVIDNNAFSHCYELKIINFPKNLKYIGSNSFENCDSLKKIKIDSPDLRIGWSAFYSCDALTSVQINAYEISENTFKCCKSLNNIEFGQNTECIGAKAFWGCESLSAIAIPASIEIIGQGAFQKTSIKSIMLEPMISVMGALPIKKPTEHLSLGAVIETHPLTDKPICVFDSDCEISGYFGTEAERYAKEWNLEFVPLEAETGDVNLDGKISVSAAVALQRYLLGRYVSTGAYYGDLNGDGSLNSLDMVKLRTLILNSEK